MKKVSLKKLVFTDKDQVEHIYVLRVDGSVAHNPTDILIKGLVVGVRIGMQRYTDVFGKDIALAARGFNSTKGLVCGKLHDKSGISTKTYDSLIETAINAAKQRANNGTNNGKLPPLADSHYHSKPIKNDGEKYFVEGWVKCQACPEPIYGRHYLILSNMRVTGQGPFVPNEGVAEAHPSKAGKWLCIDHKVEEVPIAKAGELGLITKKESLWPQGSQAEKKHSGATTVTLTITVSIDKAKRIMDILEE